MDQLILHLDATYETIATQADWVTYAANIAGEWDLCANCSPDASGKKLFRQYNFNRTLRGLPIVNTPVDNTEYAVPASLIFYYVDAADPLGPSLQVSFGPTGITTIVTAQLGLQNANPSLDTTGLLPIQTVTAGPLFDFGQQVTMAVCTLNGPQENWVSCNQNQDGAPGPRHVNQAQWVL
jgi:hypothetical protein